MANPAQTDRVGALEPTTAEETDTSWLLQVTDLKQYSYCPRIVYYRYCLPTVRPTTYKMTAGIAAQDRVTQLERRRSLRAYDLVAGERHFNVSLTSTRLGCSGQIDLVIEGEGQEGPQLVPVDFKLSRRKPGRHFKLQLACYALMLEENWGMPVTEGYLYLIPTKRSERVAISKRLRGEVVRKLATIRATIEGGLMPDPTARRSRCVNCEFRRFCNDVV